MASTMRQPLPPCCHAVNVGRKDTTKARFKSELAKFTVASKQESTTRLANALTGARSALQLDRGATSESSANTTRFTSVEGIQEYTQEIVTYLSLVKGFITPHSRAQSTITQGSVVAPVAMVAADGSSTPESALRQPLIEDYTPMNDTVKLGTPSANAAGPADEAAGASRSIGEHTKTTTYSSCLSFCNWRDVLSSAQLYAPNARLEYAQILLASGIFMMSDAREKVDDLLSRRLSEIDENELKLAYQLLLNAAGVFEACLESIDVAPRVIGAKATDLSAEPEPAEVSDGIPDDEMMKKWRAEQQKADRTDASAQEASTDTSAANAGISPTDDLAQLDRIPDLARGRYPQLLAWISLAEAQELVILRGISREFVDYSLMAKLSMDVSARYRECHAFTAQTLPCATSSLAEKLRLYCTFKDIYYTAISRYFQGAACMAKEDSHSCAQAIANLKKSKALMVETAARKQNYEAKLQKEEKDRLDTFKSIYMRSQQIVDRDLDIMTHRNDSVYYERIPEADPPCDPLSLVRATPFPTVDVHALWHDADVAVCLQPASTPTSSGAAATNQSRAATAPRSSCCDSCVIS